MRVLEFAGASCRRVRDLLEAYLANELSAETAAQVEKHLEGCEACSGEMDAIERTRAAVRGAVSGDATPPGLAGRIRTSLRAENRGRSLGARWWIAVAAVAVLAAGFAVSKRVTGAYPHELARQRWEIHRLAELAPAVFGPAIHDHIHCALYRAYPEDPPSAERTEAELGEHAALRWVIEEAAPEGFGLRLAHRCEGAGREFLHFVLVAEGRLASVALTRRRPGDVFPSAEPSDGSEIWFDQAEDLQMAGFEVGDYLAFVLSHGAPEPVASLARNLAPPLRRALV